MSRRNSVSIGGRIWRTNLAVALLIAALGAAAFLQSAPQAPIPGRLPPSSLPSTEPEQEMLSAIDGYAAGSLERSEAEAQFSQQLGVERRSATDPIQVALVSKIAGSGVQFFAATRKSHREALGKGLRSKLQQLSATKRAAARRARSRFVLPNAGAVGAPGLAALAILIMLWAASSINRNSVRRPINELVEGLKKIQHESAATLTPPGTAEFGMLTGELNAMLQRLGRASRERADELLSERATAAILGSLEDGVIVLNESSALVHINELARVILKLDPNGLIGSDFSDLAVENRRVHQLLEAGRPGHEDRTESVEFKYAYRGRDRFYAARKACWSAASGIAGTIFVLRDVTSSHDQESACAAAVGATVAALGRATPTAVAAPAPPPAHLDRDATVDAATRSNDPEAAVSECEEQPQTASAPEPSTLQLPIELAESFGPTKPPQSPAAVEAELRQLEEIEPAEEPLPAPQPSPETLHPSYESAQESAFSNGIEEESSNQEPLMLDSTVREVCARLRVQADEMGVEFVVIGADQPLAVLGDPVELLRAITGLVGEAVCHTPADGRVTVALESDYSGKLARLVVTGSGMGISAAGFGAIREVIESHCGRMVAQPDALAGVSYILELPVRTERFRLKPAEERPLS
jgi:PAS domain S-box-containing protein